jgi:hypothetical protein
MNKKTKQKRLILLMALYWDYILLQFFLLNIVIFELKFYGISIISDMVNGLDD